MESRRDVLATIAGAGTVALAGCSVFGDETIEKSAAPARAGDEALESTGFEHRNTEERPFERTVEVGGESRDLKLTNYLVQYGKEVGDFGVDGATFRLFTTPVVSVAGQDANPIQNFDDRRLVREVVQRAGGRESGDLQSASQRRATVFGNAVMFSQYLSNTEIEGQTVTIRLHFGQTTHDGDVVTILGVHPQRFDETANIYALAEALVHPAEFDG